MKKSSAFLAAALCLAVPSILQAAEDIVYEDFEGTDWGSWTTTGTAFGNGPITEATKPNYQGALGGVEFGMVNSHSTAPGATAQERDAAVGTLTSPDFTISRDYIHFFIGGGNRATTERMRLLDAVTGAELRTATGHNSNTMRKEIWDVSALAGTSVRLVIEDNYTGGWGNIGVDHIVFSDSNSIELPGFLATQRWTGVDAYDVSDLVMHDNFFETAEKESLVASASFRNYNTYSGTRVRGYITAPDTGSYTFWVSATTSGELWLSEDDTKYRKRLLARMGGDSGTGSRGIRHTDGNLWDVYSSQMSVEVELIAGQKYYFEMLSQEHHQSVGRHVSAAWARPGQAREAIPATFLSSYADQAEDADDDYLPDTWEIQYGLSATDNGSLDRKHEGELGDFDLDGLSNREEYINGTDPSNPDTDGDGLTDSEEVRDYGTDPTQSDAPSEVTVANLDLTTYLPGNLTWTMTSEGLIPSGFRGDVSWNFTVPSSGYWALNIRTSLMGDLYLHETLDIEVLIDGVSLGKSTLVYGQSADAMLRILTPIISQGGHILTLKIDNMRARRTVAIRSIQLLEPQGADLNADGYPDWVTSRLSGANTLMAYAPLSRTSPAFLEGYSRFRLASTLNGQAVLAGLDDNHWYTGLPLQAVGTTPFTLAFGDGMTEVGNIQWLATDVFDTADLVIRKGDSLKLIAEPSTGTTGQSVTLTVTPDFVVFEDFEGSGWNGWTVTGNAFGSGPVAQASAPSYQGNFGAMGLKLVNSHASAAGNNGKKRDQKTGTLTSPSFVVSHNHIHFLIGGGNHPTQERVRLLDSASGSELRTATGHNSNVMRWEQWDVSDLLGQNVKIEISDSRTGSWGNIGCDQITFSNSTSLPDFTATSATYQLASDTAHQLHAFDGSGTYKVEALHASGASAEFLVTVKQADFSVTPQDLLSNTLGNVHVSGLSVDSSLHFEGGDALTIMDGYTLSGSSFYLKAAPRKRGSYNMLARLYKDGPILGAQPLNLIGFSDVLQSDVTTTFFSRDFVGYKTISAPIVATDIPPGGKLVITITRNGVTFLDGTKTRTLYESDFTNDTYYIDLLYPLSMSGGYCHYVDIYDRNGAFIGRR